MPLEPRARRCEQTQVLERAAGQEDCPRLGDVRSRIRGAGRDCLVEGGRDLSPEAQASAYHVLRELVESAPGASS